MIERVLELVLGRGFGLRRRITVVRSGLAEDGRSCFRGRLSAHVRNG
jgi:hypothetical protein